MESFSKLFEASLLQFASFYLSFTAESMQITQAKQ